MVNLITTFVTWLINYLLEIFSLYLTKWEKHQTKSDEKLSLTFKLVTSQFINTALIYYFISKILHQDDKDELLSQEGLVFQISSLVLLEGLIDIAMNLFYIDPLSLYARANFWWNYRSMEP